MTKLVFFLAFSTLTACGDDDAAEPSFDAGGEFLDSGMHEDASSPIDATGEVDATVAPDAGDESERGGYITLASNQEPAFTRANAIFFSNGRPYDCTEEVYGDCTYYDCVPLDNQGTTPDAGDIAVTGGLFDLTFTRNEDGFYDSIVEKGAFWDGGETLRVAVDGGEDVPGLVAMISAPFSVTVTAPEPATDEEWTFSRAKDVPVTWAGSGAEEVVVVIGIISKDIREVECVFDAASEMGMIPRAALEELPAGDGYYQITSRYQDVIDNAGWAITVRTESDALTTGDSLYKGMLILE